MISIIVPAFNSEKTIGLCLDSLLKQNFKKPFEIIVVDDGSNDRTKEIIKKYKKVKLIEQKHKGPAVARNLGAKKSRGNIVLFTDSDCVLEKNWILEMVKPFKDKNIIGVQGVYRTKQKGIIPRFVQFEIENRYERMAKRKYIDFIGSYSAGYKKSVFLKFKGFDESFSIASGEDPELSFRLAKKGYKMIFNSKAVVFHQHPDSLFRYFKQKFWRAYWRILLYKKHKKKMIKESYTPQTLKMQIGFFYLLILFSILSLFSINLIYISSAFLILLFLSTLSISYKNFKKDKKIGIITPFILILRTIVFGIGLIYGILRCRK